MQRSFSGLRNRYFATKLVELSVKTKTRDFSCTNLNFRKSTGINMSDDQRLVILEKAITSYPDFPKPGIIFKDLFGAMRNPEALEVSHGDKFEYFAYDLRFCCTGTDELDQGLYLASQGTS